ncbi:MAG: hypothetical protein Kow00124_24210 [Anaerolineae bacterium]
MGDYTTVSDVKAYLRIAGSGDDALLAALVSRASRLIEDHCGRWFEARTETRRYDAIGQHISGPLLLLDADLLSVSELVNGDGAVIPASAYVLRPPNWPPYFGISLRRSSGLAWTYSADPEEAIQVTGMWGYAATAPEPVAQAALRLTAWLYRQRDNGAEGAEALPADVRALLGPYLRLRIKAVI